MTPFCIDSLLTCLHRRRLLGEVSSPLWLTVLASPLCPGACLSSLCIMHAWVSHCMHALSDAAPFLHPNYTVRRCAIFSSERYRRRALFS